VRAIADAAADAGDDADSLRRRLGTVAPPVEPVVAAPAAEAGMLPPEEVAAHSPATSPSIDARTGEPQTAGSRCNPHAKGESRSADESAVLETPAPPEEATPALPQEESIHGEEAWAGSLREALEDAVQRVRSLFRWGRNQ
jgi:hypothetical protein